MMKDDLSEIFFENNSSMDVITWNQMESNILNQYDVSYIQPSNNFHPSINNFSSRTFLYNNHKMQEFFIFLHYYIVKFYSPIRDSDDTAIDLALTDVYDPNWNKKDDILSHLRYIFDNWKYINMSRFQFYNCTPLEITKIFKQYIMDNMKETFLCFFKKKSHLIRF